MRAEALADSTDWVRTAEAIKQLQAEWKTIGPVTRGHEKVGVGTLPRRLRSSFFTRRQEDLKERKHEWSDNLAKKEALIAEAEQLAQSTEWDKAAGRIKQLQVEWKKIGPVRKNKSEVDLAAVPRGLRHVLRALQDARSGRRRRQACRSRDRRRRARRRWCRRPSRRDAGGPTDLYAQGPGRARPLSAGAGAAAPRAGAAGGPRQRGDAGARAALARRVPRHRASIPRPRGARWRSSSPRSRRSCRPTAKEPAGEPVAGRDAGAPVARSARRQHDGRGRRAPGRRRAAPRASSRKSGARSRRGSASARWTPRRASRCRTASTAPAGGSSSRSGATWRARRSTVQVASCTVRRAVRQVAEVSGIGRPRHL